MFMKRRRFYQTMASEWQTAFLSHKMPWCALLTAVKNCNKTLENCKTFSWRPRARPRPNVQDQDQGFMIQDQEQDQNFHFCPRGTSRPRPWSRGHIAAFLSAHILERTLITFSLVTVRSCRSHVAVLHRNTTVNKIERVDRIRLACTKKP